jgi:hypothetical protein
MPTGSVGPPYLVDLLGRHHLRPFAASSSLRPRAGREGQQWQGQVKLGNRARVVDCGSNRRK